MKDEQRRSLNGRIFLTVFPLCLFPSSNLHASRSELMRNLRLVLWLGLFVSCAAGAFFLHFLPSRQRIVEARRSFAGAQSDLQKTTADLKELETRLFNLQTNVDAVELGARAEYRLVRPGERLELITWRDADQVPPAL